MGTDIAVYAELKTQTGWMPVPAPAVDEYSDSREVVPTEAAALGRPYGMFSILSSEAVGLTALNDQIPRLPMPRGFPEDMNPFYVEYFAENYDSEGGDYGATWLLLSELVEFDWSRRVVRSAWVDRLYASLFHKDRPFPSLFPKEEKLLHGLFKDLPESAEKVEWSLTVAEYVGCHEHLLKQLLPLGPVSQVRLIYWFNC